MTTPRAFGVKSMDRPVFKGGYGVFYETRLIKRICMNGDLNILTISDR